MFRKLAAVAILVLLVSVLASGLSAGATTTCRRIIVTIADTPYLAHPICVDLPDGVGA